MLTFPLELPKRLAKPRTHGVTSLYDIGMPTVLAQGYMDDFGSLIDIVKLAVGTGYVTPDVTKKIEMYKSYGVDIHFGGTLFEKFYMQEKFEAYLDFIIERGINTLELSDGTVDIPVIEIVDMVQAGKDRGLKVLVEVGSKDPTQEMSPKEWIEQIKTYQETGADFIITEARDSGSSGLFNASGELKRGLIKDIGTSVDINKVLFEAPTPKSQMFFINSFGSNVNLANVKPNDVCVLEAQRLGLRYETFHLSADSSR
jgi:phosphosulfolactate synthase